MNRRLAIAAVALELASLAGSVRAEAVAGEPVPASIPAPVAGAHRDVVLRTCGQCHPIERVLAQARSAEEWDAMIAKMVERGAKATEAEQDQIYEYLVTHYAKRSQ
ncbi:MAG: hypothetical protein EBR51_09035 [Gammaproteobacteria bacterium]|jgi:hypothetical protein|nr:hypothetical protein [Gammaproteobacteria bacterium]